MEVDQEGSEVNAQTTSHSSTAGTSGINSSSEVKSRRELDRWKQKAKDVGVLPSLFRSLEPNEMGYSLRFNETRYRSN